MKTHQVKTWPAYFQAAQDGRKRFEVRRDDRGFAAGDLLVLREWDPKRQVYTGRTLQLRITYKLEGGAFGIEEGYCVLGLSD